MSETTTTEAAQAKAPPPNDVAEATDKGKAGETPEQTIEALRTALAKANAEAKDNRIKASELDQIKQAQMSDLEKAQADAEGLRKDLADAPKRVAQDLKGTLTEAFGIAEGDADLFLTSEDPKVLLEQAIGLTKKSSSTTTPKPDLSQGGAAREHLALNGDPLEQSLRSALGIRS